MHTCHLKKSIAVAVTLRLGFKRGGEKKGKERGGRERETPVLPAFVCLLFGGIMHPPK